HVRQHRQQRQPHRLGGSRNQRTDGPAAMTLTPFESTGVQTTRAEGEAFLTALAAVTDVTLHSYGTSPSGNPMTAATIGTGPAKVCILGSVHGNEPSGREAAFKFLRDLAETADAQVLNYLTAYSWSFMPTCNPDRIDWNVRNNANNIDLNRDYLALSQPE